MSLPRADWGGDASDIASFVSPGATSSRRPALRPSYRLVRAPQSAGCGDVLPQMRMRRGLIFGRARRLPAEGGKVVRVRAACRRRPDAAEIDARDSRPLARHHFEEAGKDG